VRSNCKFKLGWSGIVQVEGKAGLSGKGQSFFFPKRASGTSASGIDSYTAK
jgi:hypothetical protein